MKTSLGFFFGLKQTDKEQKMYNCFWMLSDIALSFLFCSWKHQLILF